MVSSEMGNSKIEYIKSIEEPYRNQGIAGELLKFVCDEFAVMGINTLYLVTHHTFFYERYG